MRHAMVLMAALAEPAWAQEAYPNGFDRSECIRLLADAEAARKAANDLADGMAYDFLDAHGPILIDEDPSTPLREDTDAAWEAFGRALGALCRDKL